MAGEKEVKAQVRLRFWNVKRERMVVNRNLQVTVKKTGGMTMKTLEGMLSKVDGAEQNQVSATPHPPPVADDVMLDSDMRAWAIAQLDLHQMRRNGC